MSVDFQLTIATETSIDEMARIAAQDSVWQQDRTQFFGRLLSLDMTERAGFELNLVGGRDGYCEANDGESLWVWEPAVYVDLSFGMVKDSLIERGIPNMLAVVRRVLASTTEDAALVQDGNWLFLTRTGGVLHKHRRAMFWDHYDFANEIIPD